MTGNHNNHALSDTATESSRFSESASTYTPDTPFQRLQLAIEALQHQHSALVTSTTTLHHVDPVIPSSRASPLATTVEEQSFASPSSSNYGTSGRASKRMSVLSAHSDGSVWYDAPEFDGPEEFVLDATPGDEDQSKFFEPDTRSTTNNTETVGSSDTETDADSIRKKSDERPSTTLTSTEILQVTRREELPSPPVGDEGSLFAVLKKNVGKVRSMFVEMN